MAEFNRIDPLRGSDVSDIMDDGIVDFLSGSSPVSDCVLPKA